MFQNASFVFINTKSCSKIWLCLRNQEGSVVRVAPAGKRSVRNNGTEPLVMLCVQYKTETFTAEDATDGVILNDKVEW